MLYHKIQSIYKRDERGKMILGQFSLPELNYLKNTIWDWTEKVDGMNIRVMVDPEGQAVFGGRKENSMIPAPLANRLNEIFDGSYKPEFPVMFVGEGYGAKIQSGGNYSDKQDFIVFDINIGGYWLDAEDVIDVSEKAKLHIIPIVGEGTLLEAEKFIMSKPDSTWGNFPMEGIVCRPKVELQRKNRERIIVKLKIKDYLRINDV